jgi:uncharacterized protein (TIGR03067 family)
MRYLLTGLAFIAIPVNFTAADDAAVKKEFKALEGKWKIVALAQNGQEIPNDQLPPIRFTMRPDGTATGQTPDGQATVTSSVDPARDPKTIDIVHVEGSGKGKRQYGIYKLEGGRFTIAVTLPGAKEEERPQDFTKGVLLVFERVKVAKEHSAEEKGIKSSNANFKTLIRFLNLSKQPIKVYWLNYEGDRRLEGTVQDGDSMVEETFLTHPFLVTDEKDKPWYVYFPDAQPRTVEIVAPKEKQ